MDTHHYARPASTDAHTIINTDPNTRLALQQFIGNPNLLSNINSWVYGGHFCRNVSSHDFPTRPLSQFQIARFLANFESPIISAKLAGQITLCCIDSGASAVLLSQGYYKMLFPSKRPHPYVGLPFRQASGDSLPIEGQFEASIEIGTLKALSNVIIMKSPDSHRELLIGWRFLRHHGVSICPDGLFIFPPPPAASLIQQARLVGQEMAEGDPPVRDSPPPSLFPVHSVQAYTVPPMEKTLILCKLKKVTHETLGYLEGKFMCFTSENIEKYTPILDISVYPQIVPFSELFHNVTLLYRNNTKQTQFIFSDQHIADCIQMQQASSADMWEIQQSQPDVYMACRILNQNSPSLQSPPHSQFELKIEEETKPADFSALNTHDASPAQRKRLIELLKKFPSLFSSHTWSIGEFDSTVYLRAKTNAVPQQQKFIGHPRKLERQCQMILRKLLNLGLVVENPDSPWRSNILFLLKGPKEPFYDQKKDKIPEPQNPDILEKESPHRPGKLPDHGLRPLLQKNDPNGEIPLSRIRLVLDMSMINAHLKRTWPSCVLPKIDDIFNYCYGMKVLSRLDLTQSFWSKKVNKSMMDLSTFYFMGKAYSMTRMCQGCAASSEIFQTSINKVIQRNNLSLEQNITFCGQTSCTSPGQCTVQHCGKPSSGCFAYIDDIFVVSRNESDHYIILERTLRAFTQAHLKVKLEKTDLFITSNCDILGFNLDLANSCISPAKKNLQKVMALPPPNTFRRLQKFIGSVNFYCHLLPDFSTLLAPLTDLLKSNAQWKWGPEQQEAFDLVLRKMALQPTLYLLDIDSPVYAVTDGCLKKSISYCQLQWKQDKDTWCPIRFQSHKLSAHMINYSQSQIEALSICVYASENYPLLMSHVSHVFSDARSLSFISRFRYHNLTIWRYHLLLSSLPLVFHWQSCQTPLIILVDLFTREKEYTSNPLDNVKEVLNKRISPLDIEKMQYLDFAFMPSMSYEQVMIILDAFYKILETHTPQEVLDKFKVHMAHFAFPNPPNLTFRLKRNVVNIYSNFSNNAVGNSDFCYFYPRIPTQRDPRTVTLPQGFSSHFHQDYNSDNAQHFITASQGSLKRPQPGMKESGGFIDKNVIQPPPLQIAPALERLQIFFPSCSTPQLIAQQSKDSALLKLLNDHPKIFIKIDGIICHRKIIHSLPSITICWPSHLNDILLSKAHKVNDFFHIKKNKLRGELSQLFHIRGFDKAYKKIDCEFCELNTRHNRLSLPSGVPFMISRPRTFLAMDIMYVNTAWENCAFLTICDVTNNFIQAHPVTKNATANDIYNILMTRWVGFAGFMIGICTDNARNFSCKLAADLAALCQFVHIKISPQNSKANASENCQRYLLEIVRAMSQSHKLSEHNFDRMLSLACLLWNSTYSQALKMSPAEHFYFDKIRTNSFVTFASLLSHQSRFSLCAEVCKVIDILNLVRLKKREQFLKKQQLWDTHKDKFAIGSFCWVQKDRVQKAGWKLRIKYNPILHKITKVFKTYVFVIPVNSTSILLKSPYIQGDQTNIRHRRVHKSRVKLCHDPLSYLNLKNCESYLNSAAQLLGTAVPVRQIIVVGRPTPRSSLPDNRVWNPGCWQNANLSESSLLSFTKAGMTENIFQRCCVNFKPELLFQSLCAHSCFTAFQSKNSWILVDRKLQDSFIPSSVNDNATCSYGLTTKYKKFHQQLLRKRLQEQDPSSPGDGDNPDFRDKPKLTKKKIDHFRENMDKYIITIGKDRFPSICVQKLKDTFQHLKSDSDSEEEWRPKLQSLASSSSSSSSSRSSTSLYSTVSDEDGHQDPDQDQDQDQVASDRRVTTPPRRATPPGRATTLHFVSDHDIRSQGLTINDTPRTSKASLPSSGKKKKSGMMTIEQALTPPPAPPPALERTNSPSRPSSNTSTHTQHTADTKRRQSVRLKVRKPKV